MGMVVKPGVSFTHRIRGGQGQLPGYLVQGIQGRNAWETSWAGLSEETRALTTQ